MQLDSVRELKALARERVVAPLIEHAVSRAAVAFAAGPMPAGDTALQPQRLIALGVSRSPTAARDYRLAIRLQRRSLQDRPEIARLTEMAHGEVDVQFVGRIQKRAVPWVQQRHRPLRIGTSVGHHRITAGTLGCFVRRAGDDETLHILSNNHVLANENDAAAGDAIVQPGKLDGGRARPDRVASLGEFVKLKRRHNRVDAAVAALEAGIDANVAAVRGLGRLAGVSTTPVDEGLAVAKLGRTTGLTRGRVTAFELDDVVIAYDSGNLSFDGTIEIEGVGTRPFCDGGDSGSLIVDPERKAVALLFAGSESGGSNDAGLTYANPIGDVLAALKLALVW
jgi:hypothetical protein